MRQNPILDGLTDDDYEEIRRFIIEKGNKIQAVKRLRSMCHCGLREAVLACDSIRDGLYTRTNRIWDFHEEYMSPGGIFYGDPEIAGYAVRPDYFEQIEEDLRRGRKIQAIKTLRVATGIGLKDAKEAIESHVRRKDRRN